MGFCDHGISPWVESQNDSFSFFSPLRAISFFALLMAISFYVVESQSCLAHAAGVGMESLDTQEMVSSKIFFKRNSHPEDLV